MKIENWGRKDDVDEKLDREARNIKKVRGGEDNAR